MITVLHWIRDAFIILLISTCLVELNKKTVKVWYYFFFIVVLGLMSFSIY